LGWRFTVFFPSTAAETIMKSDVVRKIGFTGSTAVGKILMKQAADTVKKVCCQACQAEAAVPRLSSIHLHA
jgi:acyl-CoA reductase-like NAD-dependent aldehyde dehydrogenase